MSSRNEKVSTIDSQFCYYLTFFTRWQYNGISSALASLTRDDSDWFGSV